IQKIGERNLIVDEARNSGMGRDGILVGGNALRLRAAIRKSTGDEPEAELPCFLFCPRIARLRPDRRMRRLIRPRHSPALMQLEVPVFERGPLVGPEACEGSNCFLPHIEIEITAKA